MDPPNDNLSLALKNFNLYDVLEPQKVHNVQTDILVDVDDDKLNPELNGSFTDKVKKSEYDLVDLFENIFVSPQHVKPKSNADFDFPPFEAHEQFDEACSIESKREASSLTLQQKQSNNIENFDITALDSNKQFDVACSNSYEKYTENAESRRIDEILDNVISKQYSKPRFKCSYDLDDEENSDRLLLNNINECNNETFTPIKKITAPSLNLIHEEKNYNELKTTSQYLKAVDENATKITNTLFDTTKFHTNKELLVKVYQNDIKSSLVDLNKPVIASKFKPPIPMLQTVKKDNKAFAKRRVVKTDKEKAGYTKGPDLYEKSLVLPQIMERLVIRNNELDARRNVTRKLLLDSSNEVNELMPSFSPIVLQSDCNGERLKDLKTRQAFAEFIKSGRVF